MTLDATSITVWIIGLGGLPLDGICTAAWLPCPCQTDQAKTAPVGDVVVYLAAYLCV